jgi:hypothetical protein
MSANQKLILITGVSHGLVRELEFNPALRDYSCRADFQDYGGALPSRRYGIIASIGYTNSLSVV